MCCGDTTQPTNNTNQGNYCVLVGVCESAAGKREGTTEGEEEAIRTGAYQVYCVHHVLLVTNLVTTNILWSESADFFAQKSLMTMSF